MRSALLAAAFVLSSLAPLFAQEATVLVTVPQQQREGLITSPTVQVPVDVVGGILYVVVNIPTADYEDPANRWRLRLYRFDRQAQVWRVMADSGWWIGGRIVTEEGVVNPAPRIGVGIEWVAGGQTFTLRGQDVRLEVEVPNRMRIGGTIEAR